MGGKNTLFGYFPLGGYLLVMVRWVPSGHWIFGNVLCKITPFLQGTSVSVSVLTLLVVSLDRFYAISQPMRARILMTRSRVWTSIVIIWLVAMAISLPLVFVNEVKVHGIDGIVSVAMCEESWPKRQDKNVYNWSIFLLLYTAPLLVMTIAYAKISSVLWNGDHQLKSERSKEAGSVQQGRRRIIKMLVFVVITFAVSWLPYHVTNMYLDLSPDNTETAQVAMYVYPVCQWLGLANSSSNPLCYCLLSRSFRHAFRSTCRCKKVLCGASRDMSGMSSTVDRHRNQFYTQVSTRCNSGSLPGSDTSDPPNLHTEAAERLRKTSPAEQANGTASTANEDSNNSLFTLKLLANKARSPNIEIRVTDYSIAGDALDATISWGVKKGTDVRCSVEDCEL